MLEGAALAPIPANADIWEKVIQKLGAGEMPPPTVRNRPDPHQTAMLIGWLSSTLDKDAALHPQAGPPTLRRLTRVEYANAVRDLLAIEFDSAERLPPDTIFHGFNNNGDSLSMSPLLLEKYVEAARQVSRLAVGDRSLPRTVYTFTPPQRQDSWQAGLPFGARGMPAVSHYFPADGTYLIRVFTDLYGGGRLPDTKGTRFFEQRVTVRAGAHRISAMVPEEGAFPEGPIGDLPGWGGIIGGPLDPLRTATRRPVLDIRLDGKQVGHFEINPPSAAELGTPTTVTPGSPWIRRVELDGPYDPSGPGTTASRSRIFICAPTAAQAQDACASRILAAVARRAFRREVGASDVNPFLTVYRKARASMEFDGSIQQALQAVLVSPGFLFRVEHDPDGMKPGQTYALDDYELATRLSFFLWSSIPDDRLLDLARTRQLHQQSVLARETRRMLADPRASALVNNFGMQFLGLEDLSSVAPDRIAYPAFNTTLRDDMGQEARLFLRNILLGNRSVVQLIGANYTYLNERLAGQYGIAGVTGPEFRQVAFKPGDARGGVLGMGAVLMVTSHTNVTSPVLRGKWVLSNLLNQPPSPPPPSGVPPLVATNGSGKVLTGRQQIEQHLISPVCASCHARMDPFGFALENFDVMGRWRTQDEGGEISAGVALPTGEAFSGPVGLKQTLLAHPDDFARAVTERLMIYALGRQLTGHDAPAIRKIVAQTRGGGYRFNDLVIALIDSTQFRMRTKGANNVL